MGWIFQAVPFHDSANGVSVPALVPLLPTAVQTSVAGHDTPEKLVNMESVGVAVGWIFQAVPSHLSTRATWALVVSSVPTAVQASAAAHDTPVKVLNREPFGVAVGWIFHAVPSHTSAKGTWASVLGSLEVPTATQKSALAHDTVAMAAKTSAPGLGVG